MKRFILFLIILLCIPLIGCSHFSNKEETSSNVMPEDLTVPKEQEKEVLDQITGKFTYQSLVYLSPLSSASPDYEQEQMQVKSITIGEKYCVFEDGEQRSVNRIEVKKFSNSDTESFEKQHEMNLIQNDLTIPTKDVPWGKLSLKNFKDIYEVKIYKLENADSYRSFLVLDDVIWQTSGLLILSLSKSES